MKMQKMSKKIFAYIILSIVAINTLFPYIWLFNVSFMKQIDVKIFGPLVAKTNFFNFQNYITAWQTGNFAKYYANSLTIAIIVMICTITFSLLMAYALVFLEFKYKKIWSWAVILGLVIPTDLVILPLRTIFQNYIHIYNTLLAVAIPEIASLMCLCIFLFMSFMKSIPKTILESARLDGATEFQVLRHLIIPIIKPSIFAIGIYVIVQSWNNVQYPLYMISDQNLYTLPLGVNNFSTSHSADNALIAAGSMIIAFPMIVIYLIFQKSILSAMTMGAVKE